jgi:hypothetical protein
MADRLLPKVIAQSLVIAVAGAAVWVLVWGVGWGRDLAWSLAAIVWIIGSPAIEVAAALRARKIAARQGARL